MKQNLLNSVKVTKPSRNVFDLSHDVKLTLKMGDLVPVCVMDCVPGDQFQISAETLIRFQPLVSPVMHRMDASIHYFFVPNRILWRNWEPYITNGESLLTDVPPVPPQLAVDSSSWTPLMDYMGIPDPAQSTGTAMEMISAIPFAAYQAIWYEYYRSQDLSNASSWQQGYEYYQLPDGFAANDLTHIRELKKRCWEHDYFTAALPWAQKGGNVEIPLGDVILDPDWGDATATPPRFVDENMAAPASNFISGRNNLNPDGAIAQSASGTTGGTTVAYDPRGSLVVGSTAINDLRRAFRLQEFLEKDARGGTRYTEYLRVHFGVTASDKRLQRPEYITGLKTPVVISEVLNTAGAEGGRPQGDMAGHAIATTSGNRGTYYCEEHGYIIGIMSILPKTAYQQGIPRHFLRLNDRYDYYHPEFAHIGEQPILNRELYAYTGTGGATFGYIPRFAEYKFIDNRVAGDFRDTLDYWHMARIFAAQPALNNAFVTADPTTRIFAVEDDGYDTILAHVFNRIRAVRPMPIYGTPSF